MEYSVAQQSNQGGRDYNEDRTGIFRRDDSLLLVIADGLGGHAGGEIASQCLISEMGSAYKNASNSELENLERFFSKAIANAHQAIHKSAIDHGHDATGPKSTCVACIIKDGVAQWAHSGDSRLYLIRKRKIIEQTPDHLSDKQDAAGNFQLAQCVGGVSPPQPLVSEPHSLQVGDTLVLATDGAWQNFGTADIKEFVESDYPRLGLDSLLRVLEQRNKAPSDNLSMVILFWGIEQLDNPQFD